METTVTMVNSLHNTITVNETWKLLLVNRMKIIPALLLFRVIYNVTALHARSFFCTLYTVRRYTARDAAFARAIECALRLQYNGWQDKKVRFSEVKDFISCYNITCSKHARKVEKEGRGAGCGEQCRELRVSSLLGARITAQI